MSGHDEQGQAFLEAIREAPEDDTHRLVYADWLDDHGNEARAKFIRLQCQLAALPSKDARRHDLAKRERELLAAHRNAWLGPLAKELPFDRCTFRRGFPEEVSLRPRSAVQFAEELDRRVPAGRVTLNGSFRDPALRAFL